MNIKTIARGLCGVIATAVFVACSGSSIVGEWVEPIPGMDSQMQGIILTKGGEASSINMATLQYEKWEKRGDKLILSGKSIGNHETISFTDTFEIEKSTESELVLRNGSQIINYHRQ